ncbi:MAG: hypothetical protein HQ567_22160 [Candidatus Nealsonbacteria bacterium]|nr:hypothetical protein [Candidatus Nealsonbacteria bacterium]
MASTYTDDFFKGLYAAEFDRQAKLDSADSLLAAVVIVLFGVGIYYLEIMPGIGEISFAAIAFYVLCGIFGMALFLSTVCVIMSVWPRWRAFISRPKELDAFVTDMEAHYAFSHDDPSIVNEKVEAELRAFLREQYVLCSDKNREQNLIKAKWQFRAKYVIALAILTLFLNGWPTFKAQRAHSSPEQVQVVDFPEVQKVQVTSDEMEDKTNGKR